MSTLKRVFGLHIHNRKNLFLLSGPVELRLVLLKYQRAENFSDSYLQLIWVYTCLSSSREFTFRLEGIFCTATVRV